MEEARKVSTPPVLQATLAAFKKELLKEHLWPQACSQLKPQGGLECLYLEERRPIFSWFVCQPLQVRTLGIATLGSGGGGSD